MLVGVQTGAASMEISVDIPQRLETDVALDPAIPLLDRYTQRSLFLTTETHSLVPCCCVYNS